MSFSQGYSIASVLIMFVDLYIAIRTYSLGKKYGRVLAGACLTAAVVDVVYLITILSENLMTVSVFSSLYFFSIDVLLNLLAYFVWHYCRVKPSPKIRMLFYAAMGYMGFEFIVFAMNPFTEIAFRCIPRNTVISHFEYEMMPLANLHLIYSYLIVAFVLAVLAWKIFKVPREYRRTYYYGALSILAIVAVNAVFLFLPDMGLLSLVDVSILGYSVAAFLIYWCFYGFNRQVMLNRLKTKIYENIDQGIILFDYEDHMILYNSKASNFLKRVTLSEGQPMEAFLRECQIQLRENINDNYSIQCYLPDEEGAQHPFRCDYRVLFNSKGERIGTLFVFVDAKKQTDLLTNFHNWEDFRNYAQHEGKDVRRDVTVGICDITGLALINSTEGHDAGDRVLKNLADLLRKHFRQDSFYLRGKDANMILLCYQMTEEEVRQCFEAVAAEFSGNLEYTTSKVDENQPDVMEGIREAERALRTHKLMNKKSIHHHALTSLMRALQECDNDTEEHVRRTRMLGENLAKRLKLTSAQMEDLSLLALLHDIGKIGVPLEILNKPGRLTELEWEVIRSHVEKGYQIAMSSQDLSGIAEMIRHHHERWDGNGYPDGLSRESIPLLSRIISVVDAYDAMVSNRSYRSAVSPEKAIEELRRFAGTQFDPFIVSNFVQMLKEEPELAYSAATEVEGEESEREKEEANQADGENTAAENVFAVHYSRYLLDDQMHIVLIDAAFTELTGYTEEDISDHHLYQIDLIPEEDRTDYLCALNEQLALNKMAFFEHRLKCKNGSICSVFCTGRIYFDSVERRSRSEILVFNSTETHAVRSLLDKERDRAKVRLEEWENIYRRDSLTGLLNRAAYVSDVEQLLLNNEEKIVFMMVDVDRFKEFNDTFGHRAGDEFLISFSRAFSTSLQEEALVCRMGGDEFSAAFRLTPGQSVENVRKLAEEAFSDIHRRMKDAGYEAEFSMGVVISGEEKHSFDQLYVTADKALYRGKTGGRNRMIFDDGE